MTTKTIDPVVARYRGSRDFTLKARAGGVATIEPHNEAAWRFIKENVEQQNYYVRDGELWMDTVHAIVLTNMITTAGYRLACNC